MQRLCEGLGFTLTAEDGAVQADLRLQPGSAPL